jgi:hypothetical protein
MKFKSSFCAVALLFCNLAIAQSSKMSAPDILGIRLGMDRSETLSLIKEKYPRSKITAVTKEVMLGTADLIYEAQYKISLDKEKLKSSTAEDYLTISFLPNDTVVGIRRLIKYFPQKQKSFDIGIALKEKYGDMSYFVYDTSSRYAEQAMWSDRMLPGLSLVGTEYVQGGNISSSDFGTVQPYPFCWAEMLNYSGDQFNPKDFYYQLTDRSGVAINRAKKWKSCGKALWVATTYEKPLYFNAVQTEIILADLASAPDLVLDLPSMLKSNPRTTYAKPVTELPKASANTPSL